MTGLVWCLSSQPVRLALSVLSGAERPRVCCTAPVSSTLPVPGRGMMGMVCPACVCMCVCMCLCVCIHVYE